MVTVDDRVVDILAGRVSPSTKPSSSAAVIALRPSPTRRARPFGAITPRGFSTCPFQVVLRESSQARSTNLTPP